MNKLIKLYIKILKSVGFSINKDYSVIIGDLNVKIQGKDLVLPTQQQIDTLTNRDNEVVKYLFNPLKESLTTKKEPAITKLLNVSMLRINSTIAELGLILLKSAMMTDKKDIPMEVAVFLSSLHKAKGSAKKVVDDKTISLWKDMTELIINNEMKIVKLYIKHGAMKEGEKYASGVVISSPLLTALEDKEPEVSDFINRRKDGEVFILLIEHILEQVLEDRMISISNDEYSADTIAFLKAYRKIANELNEQLDQVEGLDREIVEDAKIDIEYTDKDIALISELRSEVIQIPVITDNHVEFTSTIAEPSCSNDDIPWDTTEQRRESPADSGKEINDDERIRRALNHNQDSFLNPNMGNGGYYRQPENNRYATMPQNNQRMMQSDPNLMNPVMSRRPNENMNPGGLPPGAKIDQATGVVMVPMMNPDQNQNSGMYRDEVSRTDIYGRPAAKQNSLVRPY